jgi:hypothetical protein
MTAIPAKPRPAPTSWARRGRSPRNIRLDNQGREADRKTLAYCDEQEAELSDPDQQHIEHDRPGRRPGRSDEEDDRDRGEQEAQRRQSERRGLADPDLDGDEGQAPDDRDAEGRESVARAHFANRRVASSRRRLSRRAIWGHAFSTRKELSEQIVGLRRAVVEYHTSVMGHGVLISEREARMRRVEQHLNLPSLSPT